MLLAAEQLDFEKAAQLRDELHALQKATGGDVEGGGKTRGIYAKGIGSAAYGGEAPKERARPRKQGTKKASTGLRGRR